MKREFKFRGKNLQTNEWFYGNLLTFYPYLGAGDTVGQYIGRDDKNGREIYEGDIFTVNGKYPKLVKFQEECASFCIANVSELKDESWMDIWQTPDKRWWQEYTEYIEVIGNIYDNPELLESKE